MKTNELKKLVKKEFGMTCTELKKLSKKEMDRHGGCKRFYSEDKSFCVRYVSNPNFCGGTSNGYGKGFYAQLRKTGFVQEVKLLA